MNRVVMTSYTLLEIDINVVAMIYHTIPYHTIHTIHTIPYHTIHIDISKFREMYCHLGNIELYQVSTCFILSL